MPYPRKLLQDGEEVALDLQPHWWFFAKQIFLGILIFILVVLILGFLDKSLEKWSLVTWAVIAALWAGWLVLKYFDWRFTHFVVTNERVIFRTGVLAKRGVEVPLGRISNINFQQGIWERIIGAGDLEMESAGRDGQSVFDNVRHPDHVQREIYRMMELAERRRAGWVGAPQPQQPYQQSAPQYAPAPAPAPTPAPAPPTVPEQLEQLARLRDQGVINEADFEAKKAELLGRM